MSIRPAVTLYGHWTCPFVHRVAWALAERTIDHTTVEVPPSAVRPDDFVMPEEFLTHSPRREIPLVAVDDDYLADSIPILEWLETKVPDAPSLLPSDPSDAAEVARRMRWIDAQVFPAMLGIPYATAPAKIAAASRTLAAALVEMSAWLEDRPWLAGSEPTLVDAVFVPFHVRHAALERLGFDEPVAAAIEDHGVRVRSGRGWPAVAWTDAQTDETVARFEARRRRHRP